MSRTFNVKCFDKKAILEYTYATTIYYYILYMEYKKDRYYKISPQELLSELQTSFSGLKKQDVVSREKVYGKNILVSIQKPSFLLKFLKQFKDVFIILLIASDLISLYLQDFRGVTILTFIILVNAVI